MILQAIGLGDAYGQGFEFAPEDFVKANNSPTAGYVQNPKHKTLKPGRYTDDCQSSIALAAVMLRDMWTPGGIAKALLAAFKQDRRAGYAGRYYQFLNKCPDAASFLMDIKPNSDRAGAAMRSIPVGLTPDSSLIQHRSFLHASLTHATPEGCYSAYLVALVFHLLYYRKVADAKGLYVGDVGAGHLMDRNRLMLEISTEIPWDGLPMQSCDLPGVGELNWNRKTVPNAGLPCVVAALHILYEATSVAEVLFQSVALTGDVDTVAAIALPWAMYAPWIEDKEIPQVLVDDFEPGRFGMSYLKALDDRLLAKYPRPDTAAIDPVVV